VPCVLVFTVAKLVKSVVWQSVPCSELKQVFVVMAGYCFLLLRMAKLKGIFSLLYKIYFGLCFVFTLLLLTPFMFIFVLRKEWYGGIFYCRMIWSRLLQLMGLIFVVKTTKGKLPDGPFIIAPNHQSYLDIVFMYSVFSRKFAFLGKQEIASWPIFGYFFRRTDIPVDRGNRMAAARTLEKAAEALKKDRSIVIFPEGTIPLHTPKLKHFKNGAFMLAIKQQVPIVPVTFVNNWRKFSDPSDKFGPASPGTSRVIVHEAIPTKGLTEEDLVNLRQQVYKIINDSLSEEHGNH